ncbi:MAG: SDR family NAD(P)-dependent oxidoreductase [Chloroflexota bacterium]
MRFKNQITIVTGGAMGIGKAIAQAFGREGATVLILDKQEVKARKMAAEIKASGGKAEVVTLDATKVEEVKATIVKIIADLGRIDILVNNIGWSENIAFLETDELLWRKVIDLNLLVPMSFCRYVLPYMAERKSGRIINIASIGGRQPRPNAVAYGAAKAGVISMTKSLAQSMAQHHIRVNAVAPGPIETALAKEMRKANPEGYAVVLKQAAMGRMGEPEEIARAVLFLASDEAAFITGQTLNVDGGNCMI